MEEIPLTEAKAMKVQELRLRGEQEFWGVFGQGDEVGQMAVFSLIFGFVLSVSPSAAERSQMTSARSVVQNMRAKTSSVRQATTKEQVAAVSW